MYVHFTVPHYNIMHKSTQWLENSGAAQRVLISEEFVIGCVTGGGSRTK